MAATATTTTTTPSGIDELLKHQTLQTLTPDQVASFLRHGFLRVPGAIPPETCDRWTRDVWPRLGMDPEDKATWHTERSHLAKLHVEPARDLAPRAWAAICELCGGEDRIVIPCWSDVGENAGATWICDEGPRRIGKMLYDHPEGLNPMMNARHESLRPPFQHSVFNKIIQGAPDSSFHEMTGEKGDVILMHPLMLHSASVNIKRAPRIITNPPVSLRSPFQFDRADPSTYSLVELKTMRDLEGGPAALRGWKATGPRDMFMPVRLAAQERKRDEEIARLRALGIETADPEFSQGPYLLISQQQEAVTTSGLTA